MSFDVFFQPSRFAKKDSGVPEAGIGEPTSVLLNEPLSAAELQAVRNTLLNVTANGPDQHGCYVIALADGGTAEVFGSDLASGCMVAMRGMTADMVRFLFALLVAGKWIMLPAMADSVAITNSPGNVAGVPEDFPKIVACDSAEELSVILTDGVQAWERYRERVVGEK